MSQNITFKPQLKGYLGGMIGFCLVLSIITLFLIITSSNIVNAISIGFVGFIVITIYVISFTLYIKKTTYKITESKIIKNKNIFGEKHEEISLNKIQNTKIKKSYVQKKLGDYGTISVSTAGSTSKDMSLRGIENSQMIYRIITRNSKQGRHNKDASIYEEAKKLNSTSKKFKEVIKNGDKL